MGRTIGYARTSTVKQQAGLEDQVRDLLAAGCQPDLIFQEQTSSVDSDREQLRQAIAACQLGDALMATKPDRLARNTGELLNIDADLAKRGVGLVILSMGGQTLDTRTPTGRLILTVLGG